MDNIIGFIENVMYIPTLCKDLPEFSIADFKSAMDNSAFILRLQNNSSFAVSQWVSPKRTRSYPYERIYNTLGFSGRKVTIIPIIKDEGKDGDRDFIQWDTFSLMSLLGVYVIPAFYVTAEKNVNYNNKITNQSFDMAYLVAMISQLQSYQSDALHWNLKMVSNLKEIGNKAIDAYRKISINNKIELHSIDTLIKKIDTIISSAEGFKEQSRNIAKRAQEREVDTIQPKENITIGEKAKVTITNYIGGMYYFTADESWIDNNTIFLAECKHTKNGFLPSESDIKDGLIKMVLFSNLSKVYVNDIELEHTAVLKLTGGDFNPSNLDSNKLAGKILREAEINGFIVIFGK